MDGPGYYNWRLQHSNWLSQQLKQLSTLTVLQSKPSSNTSLLQKVIGTNVPVSVRSKGSMTPK